MEADEKNVSNIDSSSDIQQKQRNLRLKSRNLARRIDSIRSCCVEKFVAEQFKRGTTRKIESPQNVGDSAEKIALAENRLSINQLEEKIDRLLNNGLSKQTFRSKILRRQSSRNLASILKKYGRTKRKFQNLVLKSSKSPEDSELARKNNRQILKIYHHRLAQVGKFDSDATDLDDTFSSSDDEMKNSKFEWLAEKSYLKSRKFYLQSQLNKIDTSILQFVEFYKRIKMTKMKEFQGREVDEESCARIREFKPKLRTRLIDLQSMKKKSTCGKCYPPFSACLNCVFPKKHVMTNCQDHDYVNLETAIDVELFENFHDGEDLINEEIFIMLKESKEKIKPDSISTEPPSAVPKLLPSKKPVLKRRTLSSSSSSSSTSSSSDSSAISSKTSSSDDAVATGDVYNFVDEEDDPDWSASGDDDEAGDDGVKKTRKRRSSAAKINKTARVKRKKPKGGKIAGKLAKGQKRSKVNNSTYDIDNIVIDSSVAAASRIEILQYKEIDTPGWRQKSIEESNENSSESTSMDEQIDDQAFLLRHQEPECKEHEMFQHVQTNIFPGNQRKSVTLHSSLNLSEEKPKTLTTMTDDIAL